MDIQSSQLVAYLLSNIGDVQEAFGCSEHDLKEPLLLLNAAPDLLAACKYVVEYHRNNDSGEGELFGLDFVTTCIGAISNTKDEGGEN